MLLGLWRLVLFIMTLYLEMTDLFKWWKKNMQLQYSIFNVNRIITWNIFFFFVSCLTEEACHPWSTFKILCSGQVYSHWELQFRKLWLFSASTKVNEMPYRIWIISWGCQCYLHHHIGFNWCQTSGTFTNSHEETYLKAYIITQPPSSSVLLMGIESSPQNNPAEIMSLASL